MFNNKKDPLADAAAKVMAENELRRQVEKKVNENFGVVAKKALPHERHAEYDAALAKATEIALKEGVEVLNEGKGSKQEREIKRDEAPKATDKKDVEEVKKRITKTTGYVFKEESESLDERHSENQAWQARQYHYDVASNLRSVAKRTEPGAIKAGARELLGKFMLGGRKAAIQRNKAERHDAQKLRREADKHERAADVAHEVMLKKRSPKYKQHKWSKFKIKTPKPPKLSDMQEETKQIQEGLMKKLKGALGLRRREAAKKAKTEHDLMADYGRMRLYYDTSPVGKQDSAGNKEATRQYNIAKRNKRRLDKVAAGKKPFQEQASFESIQEEIRNNLQKQLVEAYGNEEKFNAFVDNLTEEQIEILGIKSDE